MKKYFSLFVLSLFLFIFNLNIILAMDKETYIKRNYGDYTQWQWKDCTYSYSEYGEQKNDGDIIKFKVFNRSGRYVFIHEDEFLLPSTMYSYAAHKGSDGKYYVTHEPATGLKDDVYESLECPVISIIEIEEKVDKGTDDYYGVEPGNTIIKRLVFTNENLAPNGKIVTLTRLDENGNAVIGGDKEADRTIYELSGSASLIFSDGDLDLAIPINLIVYSSGAYAIQFHTDETTYYEFDVADSDKNGIIWEAPRAFVTGSNRLVVRTTELEEIKQVCPYIGDVNVSVENSESTCNLKVYKVKKPKNNTFAICVNPPSDIIEIEGYEDLAGSLTTDFDAEEAILNGEWKFKFNMQISEKRGKCTDYLGLAGDANTGELADYLDIVFDIIKIGSIILTIVMCMLDFATVASKTNGNKDELMPMVKKWATRLIIVIVILLVPTFVEMIGNLVLDTENVLCGIK